MSKPSKTVSAWVSQLSLGRYTLLAELARGGMAELWLANQAGPGGFEKVVVVKKILPTEDDSFLTMFLDEARIAAQLSHPNIVQIFELGSYNGDYFIAMEYLHGESIFRMLQQAQRSQKPVPFAISARLIANVADGLEHAHTKTSRDGQPMTIVHRDISPQNLLVTYDGVVKVVDFGIAKATIRNAATQDGVVKGKFGYMAPEQARGEVVDAQSDVFALGAVLFEMLTGQRRVKIQDQLKAYWELTSATALESPSARCADVPPGLDAIVVKAMAKDKSARFASMRELQVALEGWLRQQPEAVTNVDIEAYMHALFADSIASRTALIDNALKRASGQNDTAVKARARKTRFAAAAVVALVVLIVAGLSLWPAPQQPAAVVVEKKREVAVPVPVPAAAVTQLVIETDPIGAAVTVDGVAQGPSPVTLEGLSLGSHAIETAMVGRRVARQQVSIESEGQHLKIVLPLMPLEVRAETPLVTSRPAPTLSRGRLTLDTVPWTRVYSGKSLLGETPLIGVLVPAGLRTLRLVNVEQGINRSIEVEISAGQTTVKKLNL